MQIATIGKFGQKELLKYSSFVNILIISICPKTNFASNGYEKVIYLIKLSIISKGPYPLGDMGADWHYNHHIQFRGAFVPRLRLKMYIPFPHINRRSIKDAIGETRNRPVSMGL